MEFPVLSELVPVVVIVGIAACIYMVAGFGFALFAVPSISLLMPVTESVAMIALLGLASVLRQSIALRNFVERQSAVRFSVWAVAGMPVGFWIVAAVSDQALRLFLGVSTIVATGVLMRRTEQMSSHTVVENLFAFISGVLNTSIGTNGSPLVFALQGRGLTPDRFRGTIAVIFAVSGMVTTSLFAIDGRYTSRLLALICCSFPTWYVGTAIGRRLATRIDSEQFRKVVLLLLAVTGISTLISAL